MLNIRSKLTNKILSYFFLNEESRIYVNEFARIIHSDPKNVYRVLLKLREDGLLADEFKGKQRYFYPDKNNSMYKEYRGIFLKTSGFEAVLKEKLKLIPGLKNAYIFGSYAAGKYGPGSDIDVLLVGDHERLKAQKVIYELQKNISREINVINITESDLKKKMSDKDQLIESIFKNKTIKLL